MKNLHVVRSYGIILKLIAYLINMYVFTLLEAYLWIKNNNNSYDDDWYSYNKSIVIQ